MFNILVVEDDKNLRKLIVTYLRKNHYCAYEALNGEEALDILDSQYIDLIISDVMMPKMDGYELTKTLRDAKYNIPIMLITAKSTLDDKREGFLSGADDYMVKPIDMEEMILRTKVLLRRAKGTSEQEIKIGNFTMDYKQLKVKYNNEEIVFTPKEFYLLYKLVSMPDTIFTRQDLIEEVWGLENDSDFRTVDVHVKRIREKIENVKEIEIKTIRGVGYKAIVK